LTLVSHLPRIHGISPKEYKVLYPEASLICSVHIEKRAKRLRESHTSGKIEVWNKNKTKEDDPRLEAMGREVSKTLTEQYASGERTAWQLGETKETNSSLAAMAETLEGRTAESDEGVASMKKTLLKKYASGEIEPWNKNKTKEDDPRIAEYGRTVGKTQRKQYAAGERKVWNAGKKKADDPRLAKSGETQSRVRKKNFADPVKGPKLRESSRKGGLSVLEKHTLHPPFKRGHYESIKTERNEWYDSSYELARMQELDFDEDVIFWKKNYSLKLDYIWGDVSSVYVPDFVVIMSEGRLVIEEVKGYEREKDLVKYQVAQKWCEKRDMEFRVLYEEDLNFTSVGANT